MLTADTYILTTDGLKQIRDLGDQSIVIAKSNLWKTGKPISLGKRKTYRLVTANGYHLGCVLDETTVDTQHGPMVLTDDMIGSRKIEVYLSYTKGKIFGVSNPVDYKLGVSLGSIEVTLDDELMISSSELLRGYLCGLFTARGGMYDQIDGSLRYCSSFNNLEYIQIVLAAFGIHSNIIQAKSTRYINLTGSAINRFKNYIGLEGKIKEKLDHFMETAVREIPKLQRIYTYTKDIFERDIEEVFTFDCPIVSANGFIIHNTKVN
jgi:hypothetical protein